MKSINMYITSALVLLVAIILFFAQDIIEKINYVEPIVFEEVEDDLYLEFNKNNLNLKLSKNDFLNGFWYEKDGEMRFFDANKFLKNGYSLEDIKKIIRGIKNSKISKKENVRILSESELPSDLQFHNSIYESSALLGNSYSVLKETLENKKNKTAEDFYRLAEIYSFEGDYRKSKQYNDTACLKDKKYCAKNEIEIAGKVVDANNSPLASVVVKVLSSGEFVKTNNNGIFSLKSNMIKLKKERISFTKKGYSDTFIGVTNISNEQKKINIGITQMNKGNVIYHISIKNESVDNGGVFKDDKIILTTDKSKYIIPKDSFVDKIGHKYNGDIVAYLFEFDANTVPNSLLSLDSFSQDRNFLGTSMVTYGMPYIIFQKTDGSRIDIQKKYPMILETRLDYTKRILNSPKISEDKKHEILENSKKGNYFYDLDSLQKTYTDLIPFWVLDQKTGVWDNIGYDVINKDGLQRQIFYTTK